MRKFDYSFLDNGLLPANLINITSNIYSLKTMSGIRKGEYEKIFTELEKIAKVQSVKSSNEKYVKSSKPQAHITLLTVML